MLGHLLSASRRLSVNRKLSSFSIITRQAISRDTHRSVKDLITAIGTFIDGWNERCQPFTWTKTAGELLPKVRPGSSQGRRFRGQ